MIVGLTGGIGSGKSLAAQYFRDLGVKVIDSDQITRELVAPDQESYFKIIERFGPNILDKEGQLNRARLRSIVFESLEDRKWLETLLHPLVKKEILRETELCPPGKYIIAEIPLLIEAEFSDSVDRVLVIDAQESLQIERVSRRDGVPRSDIQAIIASQTNRATRLEKAHDVIVNENSKEDLKAKVKNIHLYYNELAKSPQNA